MACTQYTVIPNSRGGWSVHLDSRDAGPYATRELAVQVAVAEVHHLQAAHRPVCILVEDARGTILAACCVCPQFHEHVLRRRLSQAAAPGGRFH